MSQVAEYFEIPLLSESFLFIIRSQLDDGAPIYNLANVLVWEDLFSQICDIINGPNISADSPHRVS